MGEIKWKENYGDDFKTLEKDGGGENEKDGKIRGEMVLSIKGIRKENKNADNMKLQEFKKELLKNPEFKKEFERFDLWFELKELWFKFRWFKFKKRNTL